MVRKIRVPVAIVLAMVLALSAALTLRPTQRVKAASFSFSNWTITPGTIDGDGVAEATITVDVTDDAGPTPAIGATVTFTATVQTGSAGTITFNPSTGEAVTTGPNGTATITVKVVSSAGATIRFNAATGGSNGDSTSDLTVNAIASTATPTPTETPTATASETATATATETATNTPTETATATLTETPTTTPSVTLTETATSSPTQTETPTITPSITASVTPSQTVTPSASPTETSTPTETVTPSVTNTPTETFTSSPGPSPTPTNTPSATNTATETATPTSTNSPTVTLTPTITLTRTPTNTAIPGVIDPGLSTVSIALGSDDLVIPNGSDSATIIVVARDGSGSPLSGISVLPSFASFTNGIFVWDLPFPGNARITGPNGDATFVVKGTVAYGFVEFRFALNGAQLNDTADRVFLNFINVTSTPTPTPSPQGGGTTSATNSSVSCDYTQAPADGLFTVTMTITLRDGNNQPVANHSAIPSVSPATSGLTFSSSSNYVSNTSGVVTVSIRSSTVTSPTAITISVTDQTANPTVTLAQTCQITFTASGSTPVAAGTKIGGTGTAVGTAVATATRTPANLLNPGNQGPVLGEVVAYRLRVRTGPGLQYQILGLLQYRVKVTVIARNRIGTWLQIKLADGSERWVSSRWVKISRRAFRNLPVLVWPTVTPAQ